VVPRAGKLWVITNSPDCPTGNSDKLFAIDDQLNVEIWPESIGGTPAERMIHRETQQPFIGPYAIDKAGLRCIRTAQVFLPKAQWLELTNDVPFRRIQFARNSGGARARSGMNQFLIRGRRSSPTNSRLAANSRP
jgi:hypothetical protein